MHSASKHLCRLGTTVAPLTRRDKRFAMHRKKFAAIHRHNCLNQPMGYQPSHAPDKTGSDSSIGRSKASLSVSLKFWPYTLKYALATAAAAAIAIPVSNAVLPMSLVFSADWFFTASLIASLILIPLIIFCLSLDLERHRDEARAHRRRDRYANNFR